MQKSTVNGRPKLHGKFKLVVPGLAWVPFQLVGDHLSSTLMGMWCMPLIHPCETSQSDPRGLDVADSSMVRRTKPDVAR